MKVLTIIFGLIASTLAQNIVILSPSQGQNLTRGKDFTVEIVKPDYIQSSTDIGVSISLAHCSQTPCEDHSDSLGVVMFAGGYDPTISAPEWGGYYQNFTVKTPSMTTGPAVLSVVHVELVGAGPMPWSSVYNVTVNIS